MRKSRQSARGASAYTQADGSFSGSLVEVGLPFSTQHETPAQTWPPLIDELLRIRNLKDDWDGEGTEAPDPILIDGAIRLAQYFEANRILAADRVLVGVNGTIYFEWHTPLGYQELEVTSPIDAECRWIRKGSDVIEVVSLNRW